jgi:TPR repeat protein
MRRHIYVVLALMFTFAGCGDEPVDTSCDLAMSSFYAVKYKEAFPSMRTCAESGNLNGQFMLGVMYSGGFGTSQNQTAAAYWYTLAANKGHIGATKNLAIAHYKGQGIKKDFAQAFRLFTIAAKSGDNEAMVNLSQMYALGHGTQADEKQAEYWTVKAKSK